MTHAVRVTLTLDGQPIRQIGMTWDPEVADLPPERQPLNWFGTFSVRCSGDNSARLIEFFDAALRARRARENAAFWRAVRALEGA